MKNPLKISLKTEILPIIILLASFGASIYFYLNFPSLVPSHWNWAGEVDGWSGRTFGAFFLPILNVVLYLMFLALPYLDPKKENYKDFAKVYHIFKNMIIGFMAIIYVLTSMNGLGYKIDVGLFIPVLIGILFIVMGSLMGKLKLNWMMGNRNMWTLSSETVWNKTNALTGKIFILSGILIGIEPLVHNKMWVTIIFIIAILNILLIPTVYSAILFFQEKKKVK
jgi:uncharacterized membrane protein